MEILTTRPTAHGVVLELETRSLRDEIADEVMGVLAATDRASPYAISDLVLEIPRIAGALAYFALASGMEARGGETPKSGSTAKPRQPARTPNLLNQRTETMQPGEQI